MGKKLRNKDLLEDVHFRGPWFIVPFASHRHNLMIAAFLEELECYIL
jgi:hypothetical protein